VPNFISFAASVAELPMEKNRVLSRSLSHSPSLFDVRNAKLSLQNMHYKTITQRKHSVNRSMTFTSH